MIYADYDYYTADWRGTLTEDIFARYAPRAAAYIDRVTFGRAASSLTRWGDRIRSCSCALTDLLAGTAAVGGTDPAGVTAAVTGQAIAAIRNDGFEVEYHKPESVAADAAGAVVSGGRSGTLWDTVQFWLGGTGLLYCGR